MVKFTLISKLKTLIWDKPTDKPVYDTVRESSKANELEAIVSKRQQKESVIESAKHSNHEITQHLLCVNKEQNSWKNEFLIL